LKTGAESVRSGNVFLTIGVLLFASDWQRGVKSETERESGGTRGVKSQIVALKSGELSSPMAWQSAFVHLPNKMISSDLLGLKVYSIEYSSFIDILQFICQRTQSE